MHKLFLILLCTPLAFSQSVEEKYKEVSTKIIDAALKDDGGMAKLAYLCDRIGNRLSGSANYTKAVAWSAETMRKAGLENVRTPPVKLVHWVRGKESVELVQPFARTLMSLGLGMAGGGDVTAEVVAFKSFEEMEKAGREKVEGKIVLFNPPWVNYGVTGAFRRMGPARAAKLGAKAVLIRSAGVPQQNTPHTGTTDIPAGETAIPAAALSEESLGLLERALKSGEKVVVHQYSEAKTLPDADGANVMGEIRGSEKPDEVIVLGGHLDSWDVGQGAQDDGSGVIASLQALVILKELGLKPKRTIRVVFWANEENGTRGGIAYRKMLGEDIKNHVIAIEMDGGAERPVGMGISGGGPKALDQMTEIGKLLKPIGAGEVTSRGGGTDIGPLMRDGVIGAGVRTGGGRYFEWHHTHADTLDKVNLDDLRKNIAQLAVFAYVVADMEPRLGE